MINYTIKPISYKIAMDIIIKNHYLHRKAPCSFSFGLFDNNRIIGVICYGTPSSTTLRCGICGKEESKNVIELTRLWIEDNSLPNSESFFIGNTIPLVNKEIIVSFADPTQNHVGYVYQATNWIYTGLSAKRTNWVVKGINRHCQTIADKYTSKQLKEKYGNDFKLEDRPRKHRYIYLNCNRKRKKHLLSKLRYPILPYPKKTS